MIQQNSSASSQREPQSHTNVSSPDATNTHLASNPEGNGRPFFSITERVTFKPLTTPSQGIRHLSPGVARLVSAIGLSAALLLPLSSCSSDESDLPCPVPTPTTTGTSVSDGTPTATCKTSSGRHYLWIRSRGGWVESDDGVHPKQGATGIGADEEGHSRSGTGTGHSGVGEGRGGSGHGGGEGG